MVASRAPRPVKSPSRREGISPQARRRKETAREPRKVFEGNIFVLRTGYQWKALPIEKFGSASSVHQYFRTWLKAGFFLNLWRAGLAEYDEMEGIAWKWQSVDG